MLKFLRFSFFIFLSFVLLSLNSCTNKAKEIPVVKGNGKLLFHIHTHVDSNEVDYGVLYHLDNGRKIIVTKAQMYFTGIRLVTSEGVSFPFDYRIFLKKQEEELYPIGSLPEGNYKTVGL